MTVWKKAMNYLGLGPDDAYDDYDGAPDQQAPRPRNGGYPPEPAEPANVRPIPVRTPAGGNPAPRGYPQSGEVDPPAVTIRSRQASAVRTVAAGAGGGKPHTVRPRRFDQAQEVADKYKDGQAVIVNLQDVDKDLSRRLIDFASGLCYGLGGTMEKVASGVYLLTPANVSVSPEDRRMIAEHNDD
jgi:cell division inhibitor SepF